MAAVTYGTGLALVTRLVPRLDAADFCVAGVALGDMDVHPAWQAWHLVTSTVILLGRRGTDGMHWAGTGGALGSHMTPWTPRLFAWQAWHSATWTCIAWQAWDLVTSTVTLRGRHGTDGTGLALVARLVPR